MILPIVGYGHSVLRVKTKDIDETYPNLKQLIEDMFETMYKANGIGLAAPQINLPISVLVIDADPLKENYPEDVLVPKKAMIKWVVAFSAILLPPLTLGLYVYQGHLWDEISE